MAKQVETCMNCLKKKFSLLKDLTYKELEILNNNRLSVKYKSGETIYKVGMKPAGLICLSKGKVKIIGINPKGGEQIFGFKKPVDFLGFRELMSDKLYSTSGIAIEEVEVCIIDKINFFKVVENNSDLAFKIIRHLAKELEEANKRIIGFTYKDVRARIATAIIQLHNIYGTRKDKISINVSIKRADIAQFSNMTTANAIRVISALEKEKIIKTDKREITILNMDKLMKISN